MKNQKGLKFLLTLLLFFTIGIAQNCFYSLEVYAKSYNFQKNQLMVSGEDSESIVFVIVGDGFTKKEQKLFDEKAKELMEYIIDTKPFSDMKQYMNFYTINVISKESGAGNSRKHLKNTYFQSCYNYAYGIERLLAPTKTSDVYDMVSSYVPDYDDILLLVNDERYGGSGGAIATASINSSSYEIMIHEMGHSIGALADEYWAGSQYAHECANMTMTSDPTKVPWKNLVGNGQIGVYPYEENSNWYRPSENCKMEFLGKQYPFCKVCNREMKKKLQERRWKTASVSNYYDLLGKIEVTTKRKSLKVGETKKATEMIKLTCPAILHKVTKFTQTKVNVDQMEVKISYAIGDKRIATINRSGLIRAKTAGKTEIIITAELVDGTQYEFQCPLYVKK